MNASRYITLCLAALLALILVAGAAESGPSSGSGASGSSASSGAGGGGSSSSSASKSTATQARQSPLSTAAALVGALGSLVPSLVSNVAPLVLLFGIGALMMPSLGLSAMGLLREGRRSANDHQMPNVALPPGGPFAQFGARPLQSSPQDLYYFTKRSLPSLMSSFQSGPLLAGLQDLLERVVQAVDNADKRYN